MDKDILKWLLTPETLTVLLGIIVALLGKAGWMNADQVKKAENMLKAGKAVTEITDDTKLMAHEVEAIHAEIKAPDGIVDTRKKRFSRALRHFAQGIIFK